MIIPSVSNYCSQRHVRPSARRSMTMCIERAFSLIFCLWKNVVSPLTARLMCSMDQSGHPHQRITFLLQASQLEVMTDYSCHRCWIYLAVLTARDGRNLNNVSQCLLYTCSSLFIVILCINFFLKFNTIINHYLFFLCSLNLLRSICPVQPWAAICIN